jgi:hypothetical protein
MRCSRRRTGTLLLVASVAIVAELLVSTVQFRWASRQAAHYRHWAKIHDHWAIGIIKLERQARRLQHLDEAKRLREQAEKHARQRDLLWRDASQLEKDERRRQWEEMLFWLFRGWFGDRSAA